jgi:uncharacterized protein (DUF169 family)
MGKNAQYAKTLMEKEGYDKSIVAFKLTDEEPEDIKSYGTGCSFLCAIAAEVWEEEEPFYITNKNIVCGGAVYSGLGSRKLTKESFDDGMELVIGKNQAYCSRETMRRVNQQYPHFFHAHKYMIIGPLEAVAEPDMVMIVTDAHRVMRLCKSYTWKTGELVKSLGGTAWCTISFPSVYRDKTMTYNFGDPPSRALMMLEPGDMYCTIHYDLLPLVIENLDNISSGDLT